MYTVKYYIFLVSLLLSCPGFSLAAGSTATVGPSGDYPSIASAVARQDIGDGMDESERDIIIIQNGAYAENSAMATFVDVAGENYITIMPETVGGVSITPAALLFRWQHSEFAKIQGINVNGGAGLGVFLFNNNFALDSCNVLNTSAFGVQFGGDALKSVGAAGHSHLIANCKFNYNGNNVDGGHHGILIQNTAAASWAQKIVVDNCELSGNGEDGIQTAGALDNSHADEDHIAAYVEIKNCRINDNGENGVDLKASRYVRVHHNEINGNTAAAIVIHSPENTGEPGNTGSFKNAIYNNRITGNLSRGIQTGDGDYTRLSNNLIFNNVIIGNASGGIWAAGGKRVGGDKVFNNTVVSTRGDGTTSSWMGGWGIPYEETTLDNQVIGNIVYNNANPGFKNICTFTKINNLLDNDGQNWAYNYYTDAPCFIMPDKDDYHLSPDSDVRKLIYSGQILTPGQVTDYKTLMGDDLPISENGATVDFDDRIRLFFPGAYSYEGEDHASPAAPANLHIAD
ncbi:MAG: hypothetical protein A2219_08275 [Elusimicrobia bacterium RIFOXYA2_FULL_50_26]|nr:MAG: hypothetical protein A2219_08275 [Elusimicrobia bacterium RIFOXYA2_FULL_50_26]